MSTMSKPLSIPWRIYSLPIDNHYRGINEQRSQWVKWVIPEYPPTDLFTSHWPLLSIIHWLLLQRNHWAKASMSKCAVPQGLLTSDVNYLIYSSSINFYYKGITEQRPQWVKWAVPRGDCSLLMSITWFIHHQLTSIKDASMQIWSSG